MEDIEVLYAMMSFGIYGMFMIFYFIFIFGMLTFQYICIWKIFVKAGVEGWKSLIPVYNLIVAFKFIGLSPYWLFVYLGMMIPFINFIAMFGAIALNVIYYIYLGKAFNKDTGFIVGLVLVPGVFQAILAFDKKSVYALNKEEKQVAVENV